MVERMEALLLIAVIALALGVIAVIVLIVSGIPNLRGEPMTAIARFSSGLVVGRRSFGSLWEQGVASSNLAVPTQT